MAVCLISLQSSSLLLRLLTVVTVTIFCKEDLAESRAKVRVEDGVYDRVKQTVEVAEPADDTDQQRRVGALVGTEGSHERQDEERKPADDERPGDDGQRPGRFAFARFRSLHRLRLGQGRLGGAESRQLEVKPREIESTAAWGRRHDGLIDRQHARPATGPALVCTSTVLLIRYLHQRRSPADAISHALDLAFVEQRQTLITRRKTRHYIEARNVRNCGARCCICTDNTSATARWLTVKKRKKVSFHEPIHTPI